jgi:hypothetical protein
MQRLANTPHKPHVEKKARPKKKAAKKRKAPNDKR